MAASAISLDPSGANNKVTYTALDDGIEFNALSIEYLASTGNSVALSVTFDGLHIVVTCKTDSGGTITSTANEVRAAICGTKASNTLTSNNTNPNVADTVLIGGTTYRFMDVTAQANDIFIGASADATLGSLVKVLNGTATIGASGADAFTGTLNGHALVSAGTVGSHATVISARGAGTAYNAIPTTLPVDGGGTLSWADTTLGGASATSIGADSIDTSLDPQTGVATNSPRRTMRLLYSANFAGNDGTGAVATVAATALTGSTLEPTTGYADVATAQLAGWVFLGASTSGLITLPTPQNLHYGAAETPYMAYHSSGRKPDQTQQSTGSAASLLIACKLYAAQRARKGNPLPITPWHDPALWAV